jgi:hypothetical protein
MIDWLWRKMFGGTAAAAARETDIQRELREARQSQQRAIQKELGISVDDDIQAWLRLHQLLKSHEDRIAALEREALCK